MVNLKERPFYLSDEDISWVQDTLKSMSLEEKIGQLFIMLDRKKDREESRKLIQDYHIGGCRYENESAEAIYEQNKHYQECARIPLLIACNCESGGNGACSNGTYVASAAACGATSDTKTAENTGYVSGVEASALGVNWNFSPICDIKFNWRNTVINTRAYSSDTDTVIDNSLAFIRGIRKSKLAVAAKHFPGDGVEELDQHLVMGTNNLSCEEWDNSFGRVYRSLIEEGEVEAFMVGHIAMPAYERKYNPDITDSEILPATLSPTLLKNLLRGELGFNGLLVTDASHMAGMTCAMPRSLQVPSAIAAGCDMFLFFNDIDEDFGYMMDGYRNGILTEERLDEAVTRILGLKAKLDLPRKQAEGTITPPKEGLNVVGCPAHVEIAKEAARKSITLVKDVKHQLPIKPSTHKRAYVIVISNPPIFRGNKEDPVKEVIRREMESYGYDVTMHESYYDLALKNGTGKDTLLQSVLIGSVEEFKSRYDVVFTFINVSGYAQANNVRLEWSVKHSTEIPWYVQEVPTVFIGLNYTNHLIDIPMAKTFINAYAPTEHVIASVLRKVAGEEEFLGHYEEQVFCGRWDTRV
ncbi:MAG: glycosyl hydrolase [Lachnospiraceae bacterium]|nr:glycosyl hydrolase [Lachnospiraceae bacterium]